MIVLSFPLWGHTVNTHLRDNNTGDAGRTDHQNWEVPVIIYMRTLEAQGGGLQEVTFKSVLFYYFILPWPSEICSLCCLLRHRYRLMCLKNLPRIEINSISCFNCLLLVIRVEGLNSLDTGKC